jgi:hypothetical protein
MDGSVSSDTSRSNKIMQLKRENEWCKCKCRQFYKKKKRGSCGELPYLRGAFRMDDGSSKGR